ncbi:MAG: cell division protein ZapA [Pseudomonadota bacterium]
MDNIITIELFGQQYSFKAESGVPDANEVADLLMKEVANVEKQMSKNTPEINEVTILTLAALNISSEFIDLKRNYSELTKNISERSASLVKMIDVNL